MTSSMILPQESYPSGTFKGVESASLMLMLWERFLYIAVPIFFLSANKGARKPMSSANLTHDKKITQLLKTPPLVLRLSSPLKNSCLDPRKGGDRDGRTLLKLLFEGLTRFDKQGKVALSIAKSCAVSADQTRYRITLRRTYWSNGDPVIASDFEYSWKTALAPDFPMDFPALFYMIKQAKQAKRGKCLLDDVGIQAKNPRTLLITLNHPVPDFLERLAHPLFLPIPSSIAKKNLAGLIDMFSMALFVLKISSPRYKTVGLHPYPAI